MSETAKKDSNLLSYLTVGAMLLFCMLNYGVVLKSDNISLVMLTSAVLYFVAVYLFFGIALLAYHRKNLLLWLGAAAGFIIGYMFTGLVEIWSLLTGWSLILFASVLIGRLNFKQVSQFKIHIFGVLTVIIFALAYYAPDMKVMLETTAQSFTLVVEDLAKMMNMTDKSAAEVAEIVSQSQKITALIIYLMPSFLVMTAVMQFLLGYFAFLIYLDRKFPYRRRLPSFSKWKMPFAIMPGLMVLLIARFFGTELIVRVIDNILAILSVYYFITGISLMEFYIRKLKISGFFKLIFYIMLFLTQIIGFFIAALLGLIDSFTDWRKIQQLSFVKE